MKSLSSLLVLVLFLVVGCSSGCADKVQSISATAGYNLDDHEITIGATIVFKTTPPEAVSQQLLAAGAAEYRTDVRYRYEFTNVDTDAKRYAVNAALLAGAVVTQQVQR